MVEWIIVQPEVRWDITKAPQEQSQLNPYALIEAKKRIGQLILEAEDEDKAMQLTSIYKSMNEAIEKSL